MNWLIKLFKTLLLRKCWEDQMLSHLYIYQFVVSFKEKKIEAGNVTEQSRNELVTATWQQLLILTVY